ncbi:MAG: geranylgeranylglyceryl/heptaprenylglyceryl phosphate synthase [Bacteroidia bacterium]
MKFDTLIATPRKAVLSVLIDPDKFNPALISLCANSKVKFFLVGGSRLKKNNLGAVITAIKKRSSKPVIIFPGDETQLSASADGLLLLSLVSGRNPDYLIGKQVKAASKIRQSKLATLPTAYMLIDGQTVSSTQQITNTTALPRNDLKLITDTAIASELLGFRAIYLEAGSGAKEEVRSNIIRKVKAAVKLPVLVGGGIDSYAKAKKAVEAGANVVVVGNALEKNIYLISEIEKAF